jgi:hypothetical protein
MQYGVSAIGYLVGLLLYVNTLSHSLLLKPVSAIGYLVGLLLYDKYSVSLTIIKASECHWVFGTSDCTTKTLSHSLLLKSVSAIGYLVHLIV